MEDKQSPHLTYSSDIEEHEINLREYLFVILKRKWMILAVTVIVLTLGIIHALVQTPIYKSVSSVYIDRYGFSFVSTSTPNPYDWQGYEAFFNTQYKLLKSKSLAMQVVERLNISHPELLARPEANKKQDPAAKKGNEEQAKRTAGSLLGMVEIEPVKGTNLCEIVVTGPEPELVQQVANAWAEQYVDFSLSSQYEFSQKAEEVLEGQIQALQAEIAQKEKLLQEYSLEKRVVKLDKERSMSSSTLEQLNTGLSTATQERIAKEVHYNELRSNGPNSVPEITNSSVIQELRGQYSLLDRQYSEKSKLYKAEYPEMVRLRTQMDQIKRRISQEASDLYEKHLAAAGAAYQQALNKEEALKNQMERTKRTSAQLYKEEFDYDRLMQEIDNKKQLLESLLRKSSETNVSTQIKEKRATTIRVVERAEKPSSPYKPNLTRNIQLSLIFGLLSSVGLAFLLEYLDRSMKSAEDVERHAQLAVLGIVPRYYGDGTHAGNGAGGKAIVKLHDGVTNHAVDLLTLYNPDSVAAEAVKTIRTSLLLSFPGAPPRTILVTSSRPGEGKTFIACNLALALAQLDRKVVLIDGDMRNPRIHRVWGIRNERGLSQILTSHDPASSAMSSTGFNSLSVLPSGAKTPRPAELLSSERIDELISELKEDYDHIIFDSPPLMPVADSMILAAKCNCVVIVIHGGVTPRDVVQMAKQKLVKAGATLAGAVLNCVDLSNPYYYSYYSSYYGYGYGKNDSKPKELTG